MKHNGKCTKLWVCATQHMYAYNGYAMCVMLCYAMPFHGHFLWHGMSCHVALCYAFVCVCARAARGIRSNHSTWDPRRTNLYEELKAPPVPLHGNHYGPEDVQCHYRHPGRR